MNDSVAIFDRALLAQRRRRAAAGAGAHDFLLRRVLEDFADRLSIVQRTFPVVLCLPSHQGLVSSALAGLPSLGRLIEADTIPGGPAGKAPDLVADEEALPFSGGQLDAILSALSLQFANDLPGALIQMRRALKPDGLLLASFLGGATLKELREAWLVAEDEVSGGASPRVAPFADVRDAGALLQRAGFALPVVDSDTVTATYATPLDLMRDIKGMGASNALHARRRVPVTRGLLLRAAEVYAERFGLPNGRIPATFEIITMTAWVPHESQPQPLAPGSAKARLADALGVREHKPGSGDPAKE
jgi:SAM-dependent methyltransferase